MIGRLRHLSEGDWDVLDRVLAAALFALMAVELTLGRRHGPLALELVLAALMGAALLRRRRNALLTVAVVVPATAALFIGLAGPSQASSVVAAVLVAGYSSGAHLDQRASLAPLALLARNRGRGERYAPAQPASA